MEDMMTNIPTDRPLTAGDDWIEWHGGENPVPGTWVEVSHRGRIMGFKVGWGTADNMKWTHNGSNEDIIAYRLARAATSTASEVEGDRIGTHGPDCWGWGHRHYGCALREIDRLAALASPPVSERERELEAEVARLRDVLLGIAESDHYRRYPKQHEDGGLRGQSGLRAVRALTGKHGSYINDDEVRALDAEQRRALTAQPAGEGK